MKRSFGSMGSLMKDDRGVWAFHWSTAEDYGYSGERKQKIMGKLKDFTHQHRGLTSWVSLSQAVKCLWTYFISQSLETSLPAVFSPWVSGELIAEEALIERTWRHGAGRSGSHSGSWLEHRGPWFREPRQDGQRTSEDVWGNIVLRKTLLVRRHSWEWKIPVVA